MSDRLMAYFHLWAMPGIGVQTMRKVLDTVDSKLFFTLHDDDWLQLGFHDTFVRALRSVDRRLMDAHGRWLAQHPECQVLAFDELPPLLKAISDPPIFLFAKGEVSVLHQPLCAIVGSRRASEQGKLIATEFAKCIAKGGYGIVSGMALGIDGAAHEGALCGDGQTIAVLGTGLQHIYPRSHIALSKRIASQGVLVTEVPPLIGARPESFPIRNRIISGLGAVVLVIEAAVRSGSLITAQHALAQGRDVFAVPGSILNSSFAGCHRLIQEGAQLAHTPQDVVRELARFYQLPLQEDVSSSLPRQRLPDENYRKLLSYIDDVTTPIEVIIRRSGLTSSVISSMLMKMVLAGIVTKEPGGYQQKRTYVKSVDVFI